MEKKFNEKKSLEKPVKSYKKPAMRVVRLKHEAHLLAASGGIPGIGLNPQQTGGSL